MQVFGTQMHIVTLTFIVLEAGMFIFQLVYYLQRPQDQNRLLYLILLILLLVYNITGGLFPDPEIGIPIATQMMLAYGSGFLMASYFPFYFYKACGLTSLRWHAFYGVPLFLMLPYLVFFVVMYAINGDLNRDIVYGMIIPFIYATVLLWVMLRAIRRKFRKDRDHHQYLAEIAMYCAMTPWASLTFFGLIERSQVIEALCMNTGMISVSIIFIWRSILTAREEYQRLMDLNGQNAKTLIFERMCRHYRLTIREMEIVLLIQQGLTYKQISEKLFIAVKTVENHIQHIYAKAKVSNKIALLRRFFDGA